MNTYPMIMNQNLLFRSKQTTMANQAALVTNTLVTADELTSETVTQAIAQLEDLEVQRLVVTDEAGLVLYDTGEDSAVGKYLFLGEIVSALEGNDAFSSRYQDGVFYSRWATPVMDRNQVVGAVYLYEEDSTIRAVQPGSFRYLLWQDDHFVPREETRSFTPAQLTMTPCPEPFAPPYEEELCLGGRVPRHWYRLEVSGSEGFLRFPQRCDVAQIYADGALAADNFYNGEPWRVPASLLYGRQCYLVMTPPSDAVFMDP